MNILNNNLLCVITIILIMNNAYGQSGGDSGSAKVQTDLVLNVSYNKSSGYDGDNITIQYILSNVGTKKNQEALNIIISENIPIYFAKPSRKLLVSNDKLTDSDPQNRYISLNTSKVEEASEYKLLLDTNGCLIINCSKLDPNNDITIYYSTYINYTGNENANSFSSVNVGKYYENVRNYSNPPTPFVLQTRPIIVSVQDIYYSDEKYYILNNSEININYYLGNAKNKNISYIYKTKKGKYFTELTSENRINKSGEVYFGLKLDGENPKYNQSIFIVEDLATYHNFKWLLLYLLIIFASILIYSYVFELSITDGHLILKEKLYVEKFRFYGAYLILSRILLQGIVLLILFALDRTIIEYIFGLYYSDVFLWQLGSTLISYFILINLANLVSETCQRSHCHSIKGIFTVSLVSALTYFSLPIIIIDSPPTISALLNSYISLQGIGFLAIILIFLLIIMRYIYNYMTRKGWLPHPLEITFYVIALVLLFFTYKLKKTFEYPIPDETSEYISLISMSTVIIIGLLLIDKPGFRKACDIWPLNEIITRIFARTQPNDCEATSSDEDGRGGAPPKKE